MRSVDCMGIYGSYSDQIKAHKYHVKKSGHTRNKIFLSFFRIRLHY